MNDYIVTYLAWLIPMATLGSLYGLSYLIISYLYRGTPAFSGLYIFIVLIYLFLGIAATIPSLIVNNQLKIRKFRAHKTTAILLPVATILTVMVGNFSNSINSTYNVQIPTYILEVIRYSLFAVIPLYIRFVAKKLVKN
jgi:hypothetical protein